jgi:hypothetical protein
MDQVLKVQAAHVLSIGHIRCVPTALLPQALTPLVGGVLSLNNFEKPVIVRVKKVQDGPPAYSALDP